VIFCSAQNLAVKNVTLKELVHFVTIENLGQIFQLNLDQKYWTDFYTTPKKYVFRKENHFFISADFFLHAENFGFKISI